MAPRGEAAGGGPELKAETQRWPSRLEHPGLAVKPVTWARGTKKLRGRQTERGGERKRRGRRGGPKASVDAEASAVGRKEANEMASEQDVCDRGHAGSHEMRDSPGDQGRHRKKAEDNGSIAPGKGHPVRGSRTNRRNRRHTPPASQGRA